MSQGPQRRLAARRGSVSAPDPFGKHASLNHDPNRSSSSRLTIVRVVDSTSSSASPNFAMAPISLSEPPSSHNHHRRSLRRHGSTSSSTSASDNRLSFAFSSFSPASPSQTSPSQVSSSTAQNPSSRAGSSPSSSPRLRPSSPSQFTRRLSSSGTSAFSKPNLSPDQLLDLARQSTSPRYVQQPTSHPAVTPASPGGLSPAIGPIVTSATFTPLPADVYLPFIDRPAEVTILLSTPPTTKLLSLLAQTFPKQISDDNVQFGPDPSLWSFIALRRWLTTVDRTAADDATWVRNARKCVLSHSELIWERLKGALGVPPELELEEEDMASREEVFAGDINSTRPESQVGRSSNDVNAPQAPDPDPVPTSHNSPSSDALTIEPIIATPSSNLLATTPGTVNPPPLSLPSALSQSASMSQVDQGLQNIVEDGEEEESEVNEESGGDAKAQGEPESQIHGLRLSTSSVPSSPAIGPHVFSYPPSPIVNMGASGRNSVEPRSPEFYLPPLTRRLSRTSSHGSVTSLGRPISGSYTYRDIGYNSGSDFGDSESERAYDPVGDRAPGNPLFPSNFARLALGPTLRANNPSLRSTRAAPTYPRFSRWAPDGRPPSWVEGWDPIKQEYAVTIASGSSVGVGGGE
ncbi:hypothetical protein HYDPIDRAFT_189244 [Hydnomerulius pinastri MD-312]|uniref:Uncharacterized protein n=1 Tax=Hydnomerulius pinastri MD-312 TaxID=994086 RepID=A0A0C9V8C7_9AGAM|nr:hypothetical protein HYDPIDRAFT_189244 [Hydnomerulius pinastri MD-312]